MASNLFTRWRKLNPESPLQTGTAVAVNDGSVIVETPGGGRQTVRGEAAVDDIVYFRAGAIEGPAPDLPYYLIEV